ncbi:MAG: type II 3-dehydroquinate dehydratase [Eggerthellaceae bacterium]|nr:type II 3-dehydroquinate dehydratase [Eggerthellaceae bacterium]
MKKILLMNGPNLNMLGIREPGVYGTDTLASIEAEVVAYGAQRGVEVDCFQSNHEGELIDKLHEAHTAYDGVVYNPGAHTHYSYAVRDAIGSIDTPVVEVHLSDIDAREPFRAVSVVAPACVAQVKGFGKEGYLMAVDGLLEGWSVRLSEGFDRAVQGKVIVGTPDGPAVR